MKERERDLGRNQEEEIVNEMMRQLALNCERGKERRKERKKEG